MAARASATEAERDAAIEEAAQAIFCLQRARKELEALKRSVSDQQNQCNCCCSSTKSHQEGRGGQHSSQQLAEREVATTRNDQILRQLGQIVETIWETLQAQHSKNEGTQSTTTSAAASQTLSDVKLAVLEQFRTLVSNEERHVYGEMHALYTEVARHEKLQVSMAQRIQTLTCENEELERRVQGLEERLLDSESEVRQSALVTPLHQEETTDLRHKHKLDGLQQQLDERESQIKQLLKMVEMQAAVISAEPVASPHEDDEESSDVQDLRCTSRLVSESRFYDEYDEYDELEVPIDDFLSQKPNSFDEVHQTFSGYESQSSTTGRKGKSNLRDARDGELSEAVDILQAQLEMYIRCFQRRSKSKR